MTNQFKVSCTYFNNFKRVLDWKDDSLKTNSNPTILKYWRVFVFNFHQYFDYMVSLFGLDTIQRESTLSMYMQSSILIFHKTLLYEFRSIVYNSNSKNLLPQRLRENVFRTRVFKIFAVGNCLLTYGCPSNTYVIWDQMWVSKGFVILKNLTLYVPTPQNGHIHSNKLF